MRASRLKTRLSRKENYIGNNEFKAGVRSLA